MNDEAFGIYELRAKNAGTLGLCPMPKCRKDIETIKSWKPDAIVSLVEDHEYLEEDTQSVLKKIPKKWHHIPTKDFGAPEEDLRFVLVELNQILSQRGRILAHCLGGNGRSGMLILRLMVDQGEAPLKALVRLRKIRPNAVETKDQEIWASVPLTSTSKQIKID